MTDLRQGRSVQPVECAGVRRLWIAVVMTTLPQRLRVDALVVVHDLCLVNEVVRTYLARPDRTSANVRGHGGTVLVLDGMLVVGVTYVSSAHLRDGGSVKEDGIQRYQSSRTRASRRRR